MITLFQFNLHQLKCRLNRLGPDLFRYKKKVVKIKIRVKIFENRKTTYLSSRFWHSSP